MATRRSPTPTGGQTVDRLIEQKDDEIARIQLKEEREFQDLADTTARLSNGLRVNRAACGHLEENITASMKRIYEDLSARILRERQERHGIETRLERLADENAAEVRGCLAEDAAVHKESEAYTREIRDEICHLYSDVEQARQYRIDKGQKLVEGVKLKLGEIREAVSAERRIRLESESTLLELFGQMGQKMEQEMENARKERHMATDRIITLMETVLPKIDDSFKHGVEVCHDQLHDNDDAKDMATTAIQNMELWQKRSSVSMKKGSMSYRGSTAAI